MNSAVSALCLLGALLLATSAAAQQQQADLGNSAAVPTFNFRRALRVVAETAYTFNWPKGSVSTTATYVPVKEHFKPNIKVEEKKKEEKQHDVIDHEHPLDEVFQAVDKAVEAKQEAIAEHTTSTSTDVKAQVVKVLEGP